MEFQLGTNSERLVLPVLKEADEEIFVCSPFLSPKYARIMKQKAEEGIAVDVVTTDSGAGYHRKALRILQGPRKPRKSWIGLFVLAGFFACLSFLLIWSLAVAGLLAIVGFFSRRKYKKSLAFWKKEIKRYRANVRIDDKVHAKFYSSDGNVAVVGSPNLTSTGLQKHIEYVELKEGEDARELIDCFRDKLG